MCPIGITCGIIIVYIDEPVKTISPVYLNVARYIIKR